MKKYFKWYLITAIILILVFNAICFVLPNSYVIPKEVDYLVFAETGYFLGLSGTYYKYGGSFWVGYISIMISFIGNLLLTYFAFSKSKTKNDNLYDLVILRTNLCGLVLCFIVSIIIMFVPNLSIWLGTIICLIILVICSIKCIVSFGIKNIYSDSDKNLKDSLNFIENLKSKSKVLYENCDDKEKKKFCKKVYDEIKYSDPVSNDYLKEINKKISSSFNSFEKSIDGNDNNYIYLTKELIKLIEERNEISKNNK